MFQSGFALLSHTGAAHLGRVLRSCVRPVADRMPSVSRLRTALLHVMGDPASQPNPTLCAAEPNPVAQLHPVCNATTSGPLLDYTKACFATTPDRANPDTISPDEDGSPTNMIFSGAIPVLR